MNAYKLADQLDNVKYQNGAKPFEMYANMLRQQADRIDKLEREAVAKNNYLEQHCEKIDQQADLIRNLQKSLGFKNSGYETINLTPQTKPLSDEEILNEWLGNDRNFYYFARAIEERHGIK